MEEKESPDIFILLRESAAHSFDFHSVEISLAQLQWCMIIFKVIVYRSIWKLTKIQSLKQ